MISRVVEAKPEELRIFLEEAAGVSKYRERRKETEGRLADTRENLARVEDIRLELGNQLGRLEHQAKVAGEYRELEARLALSQQMLWFSRQQDAVRSESAARRRSRSSPSRWRVSRRTCARARRSWSSCARTHYAAGDELHDRQGRFYAANTR